jgi:putative lipoic acid-binding regulatory protein
MSGRLDYKLPMEKIPNQPSGSCRAKIDYPCVWQYKVIGMEREAVRAAIAEHVGDVPYSLADSRKSSGGKYISLTLELTVYSDYHRLRLYQVLGDHPDVKVVL